MGWKRHGSISWAPVVKAPRIRLLRSNSRYGQAGILQFGRRGEVCAVAGRKWMLSVCVFAVLSISLSVPESAVAIGQPAEHQAQNTGQLSATIVDPTGALIPGAQVTLSRPNTPSITATSDSQGMVTLPDLQPGDYAIDARANGFSTVKRPHVIIRAGQVERLT
ncbi:MAG: carboxypeptidase-like regulatory domain-containing protein, partial [Acidobacteriaceae bacterium]